MSNKYENVHKFLEEVEKLDLDSLSPTAAKSVIDNIANVIIAGSKYEVDMANVELKQSKLNDSRIITYTGNIWAQHIVYEIRCRVNNMRYIGKSHVPFFKRYPKGFHVDHHNQALMDDVERYGSGSFDIIIDEMPTPLVSDQNEHERIIRANPEYLYNVMIR